MTLPPDFVFTQNNLQDFVDCPRRFQLKYLLKMAWPAPISEPIEENDRLIQFGSRFHQMVHQYFIGIPEEKITRFITDEDLRSWWASFITFAPVDIPVNRQPEIDLSMPFENFRLAAKIDLLAVEKGKRAVIIDWKTTHKPPKPAFVTNRIQSLVYPFLVISTGSALNDYHPFDPSQVVMTYWYPAYPDKPIVLTFDNGWLEKTRLTLTSLVVEASQMNLEIFPLTVDEKKCQFCRYRSLCERGTTAGNLQDDDQDSNEEESPEINFNEIEGIAF
jgi:hypothetical protein